MIWILYIFYFVTGAVIGSFSNMLVYRYIAVQPILSQSRSYCPNCKETLKWYHLIPILSFVFLRGKCGHCKDKIHPRYLLLELFSATLFLLIMINVDFTPDILGFFFFVLMLLIPVLIIDIMVHLIFDEYLKVFIVLTFVALAINQYFYEFNLPFDLPTLKNGLIGFFVIYIAMVIFNKIGGLIFLGDYRFDVIGMGDVKLLAWMYLILGSYAQIGLVFFLAAAVALILFALYHTVMYIVSIRFSRSQKFKFTFADADKPKKMTVLNIKINDFVNPTLYEDFEKSKILPHTFLVNDIDEKSDNLSLHTGNKIINFKFDKEVIQQILTDKKEAEATIMELYLKFDIIIELDENTGEYVIKDFVYKGISDYELYLQSVLRTKLFAFNGLPFAPALVFAFLIVIVAQEPIIDFVQDFILRGYTF